MTPERVHVVVPGPLEQRTGGYLYDARMVDGLRRRGWRVEVHSLPGRFPDVDEQARDSLRATLDGLPAGARVVLDGLAMGGLPGPVVAHRGRLRLVSLVHHPLADETGIGAGVRDRLFASEREALRACVGVITTSACTARRLAAYGVAADRIRAVPPGTEPARPAVGPPPGEPPALLCVGTLTPRKGHEVLVEALGRLRDVPWRCVCAGSADRDPRFAASVSDRVEALGLTARIDFVGELDAGGLDELYGRSSLFVLASHYEGYGMALAEALARGLPVVSTTGGAIPDTVPEGAGVLVEPGDARALEAALRALLDDPGGSPAAAERRARLAAGARRHAATLPDWQEAIDGFAAALRALAP